MGDFAGPVSLDRLAVGGIHLVPVVRMDGGEEGLVGGVEPSGIDIEDAEDLVRPVEGVGRQVEFPVADRLRVRSEELRQLALR